MSAEIADLAARRRRKKGPACPICRKPVVEAFRPFCSARCRKIDLDRWLGEAYRVRIPDAPRAEDDDEKA